MINECLGRAIIPVASLFPSPLREHCPELNFQIFERLKRLLFSSPAPDRYTSCVAEGRWGGIPRSLVWVTRGEGAPSSPPLTPLMR